MTYCTARLWIPRSPVLTGRPTLHPDTDGTSPAFGDRQREPMHGSRHDFDFLVGSWDVLNRRLKVRNAGSDDWDEFPGRATVRWVLGGLGNLDEIDFPTKGWSGATFRLFNPESRLWSLHRVTSRDGRMLAPVIGAFHGNEGTFYGDDTDEGRAVRVRYRWTRAHDDFPRWEQAFSLDGEKRWETNWVMELRRAG